jgi:ubiquinone/menaquinone biosynthesis C-methylase UbiE
LHQTDITKILQCPLCKTGVTESLQCPQCGEKYIFENDVYVMVNKNLSRNEWKWDLNLFNEDKIKAAGERYKSFLNEDTKKADDIWHGEMSKHIAGFYGIICDVATGLGGMLDKLMASSADFQPIATDVDPNVLAWTTRKVKEKYKKDFISIATDGKNLALADNSVDYVTSRAALGNIPDTRKALREQYRILKNGGRFVMMSTFVKKWSKSHLLAKFLKMERGLIKEYLLEDMSRVGFKEVQINIISSAVWTKNPMDALPVAGDTNYYAIVEARK